jgi:hypothetical protein
MKCSASITLAEIYTMGYYFKGVGEYGFGGDAQRTAFEAGMTNAIQVVPDYLKISIDAAWELRWESRQGTFSLNEEDIGIDTNGDGTIDDTEAYSVTTGDDGQHTAMLLKPTLALGGSVPDTGITWGVKEAIEMEWNPENYKDTDPTYNSWDGDVYDPTTGALVDGMSEQNGAFDYAKFISQVDFAFEFFHFFAPENITGTISAMYAFKVKCPYSYYIEKDKEINNEAELKFSLGLAGVTVYIAGWLETADFANTGAPLDGDSGSYRNWDGTWNAFDGNDWSDKDATSHARPNMKIGPKVGFSYSKEWLSFGLNWKGFLDGIRKWDEGELNSVLIWNNEFDISVGFSL